MQLFVQQKRVVYCGQIKNLLDFFSSYPPETTLKDFIKLHLN